MQGQANGHVSEEDPLLSNNDTIYNPKGWVRCLANKTYAHLHLVEVQSGNYLGEDDIERL